MDKEQLHKRLMAVWRLKCYSVREMADAIGIARKTLNRFVEGKEPILMSSLMKIERYVSDMEFDHGIES